MSGTFSYKLTTENELFTFDYSPILTSSVIYNETTHRTTNLANYPPIYPTIFAQKARMVWPKICLERLG